METDKKALKELRKFGVSVEEAKEALRRFEVAYKRAVEQGGPLKLKKEKASED